MTPISDEKLVDEIRLIRDQMARLRSRSESRDVFQIYKTIDDLYQRALFSLIQKRRHESTDHPSAVR